MKRENEPSKANKQVSAMHTQITKTQIPRKTSLYHELGEKQWTAYTIAAIFFAKLVEAKSEWFTSGKGRLTS